MAALPPAKAQAHVFQTSEAVLFFNRDATEFVIQFQVVLEAVMAEIDPIYTNTNDSPNAPEYNRLRALSGAALQAEFDPMRTEFLSKFRFMLDGKPVAAEFAGEVFRDDPDLTKARNTTIDMKGRLPPGAKQFAFGWDPSYGKLTMRTVGARTRSMSIQIIENGNDSAPMVIDDLKARGLLDMVWDFLVIGYTHIMPDGIDHILFVVGIFLLSTKIRPILMQVTAFTLAHTLTLGLGAAGVVAVPAYIVEPLIAASIAYVAVENILRPTLSPWRPVIVFGFGLLHGLGFASFLREVGIPEGDFVTGLLSFNVGVELGQLTVIAICYLLVGIWFGNKPWYRKFIVIPGSLVIAAIGLLWTFERIFLA